MWSARLTFGSLVTATFNVFGPCLSTFPTGTHDLLAARYVPALLPDGQSVLTHTTGNGERRDVAH